LTEARILLDEVLSGEWPSEERLASAVRWPEGQHLEFKQAFTEKRDAAEDVRKEVSAFANGEGGLLVLGVTDESRELLGWPRYGKASCEQWVVDVTGSLLYGLARPLRIREYAINDKTVVLVGVDRGLGLISVREGGEEKHYVRSGASAVPIPQSTVMDIVLGRRSHPRITCRLTSASILHEMPSMNEGGLWHLFDLRVVVQNDSLVGFDRMYIGALFWAATGHVETHGAEILKYVDIVDPGERAHALLGAGRWQLRHQGAHQNRPFVAFDTTAWALQRVKIPVGSPVKKALLEGAIYVAPWQSPPTWFQFSYRWEALHRDTVPQGAVSIEPSARPRIAWTPIVDEA
jgi:hypothetical protein